MGPELERLFLAVYEAPADDARKHVLADALQAEGDARGDFIALQLRGSVIARRRADKLLARHRDAFLGALKGVILSPRGPNDNERLNERWEKGFLVECTARLSGTTSDRPEWATVEALHVFGGPDDPAELALARFTSLRTVAIYGSEDFDARARTRVAQVSGRNVRVTHLYR